MYVLEIPMETSLFLLLRLNTYENFRNLHLWPLGFNVYQMLTLCGELLRHGNLINFELPYKSNNDTEHDIS